MSIRSRWQCRTRMDRQDCSEQKIATYNLICFYQWNFRKNDVKLNQICKWYDISDNWKCLKFFKSSILYSYL
jgi:hypothetical protein